MKRIEVQRVWAQGSDALQAAEGAIAALQAALADVQKTNASQASAISALQSQGGGVVQIACTARTMAGGTPQATEATLDDGAGDAWNKIAEAATGKPLLLKYADPDGVPVYFMATEYQFPTMNESNSAYAVFNTFRLHVDKGTDGSYTSTWSANS